jgi:uncharacterized protein YndB with AHSA1/START domain
MDLQLTKIPVANAELMIRKPAIEVYEAFVNPTITTKFWFTRRSSRLEVGMRIRWDWEMYSASTTVNVKALDPGKRILLEKGVDEEPTTVAWIFSPRSKDATLVIITNSGFKRVCNKVVAQAMRSVAGFELILAWLKAYLDHGIILNLIADRFPDNLIGQPQQNHSTD